MAYTDIARRLIDVLLEDSPRAMLDELAREGFFHENVPAIGRMIDMRGRGYKHPWPHTLQVTDQARMEDRHLAAIREHAAEYDLDEAEFVDLEMTKLGMSALLHDLGKTETMRVSGGEISFPRHHVVSAKLARRIAVDLGFDPEMAEDIGRDCYLHHSISTDRLVQNELAEAEAGRRARFTKIERLAADLSGDDPLNMSSRGAMNLQRRLSLIEADASSLVDWKKRYVAEVRRQIEDVQELRRLEEERIRNETPILDGNELMSIFGLPPGRWVGDARRLLVEDRREHPDQDRKRAIRLVRELIGRS